MQPTPYLFFEGDCFEAMTLYAETLGGTVEGVVRNADAARPEDRMPGPDDAAMNMVLRTDGGTVMASDAPAEWHSKPQGFRLQLEAASGEEFDRLLGALGRDARAVDMPVGETFWAERFTMFTDRFGTPWMLSFTGAKS
jgi:PhnB protein